MTENIRSQILAQTSVRRQWNLGKFLYQGVTPNGFPWVAWENKNFGSLLVGESKDGHLPKSKLRNDASSGIDVRSAALAARSAEWMSKEIVY